MDKLLIWMVDTWQTPPMGADARVQAGYLLRKVQKGENLGMPDSRPMTGIGKRVYELRIKDGEQNKTWRVIYRIDRDMIIVVHWFQKTTDQTPQNTIKTSKARLAGYDARMKENEK